MNTVDFIARVPLVVSFLSIWSIDSTSSSETNWCTDAFRLGVEEIKEDVVRLPDIDIYEEGIISSSVIDKNYESIAFSDVDADRDGVLN